MSILHQHLPRKAEYIIYCPLTPVQMRLYGAYLAYCVGIGPESDTASVVQAARGGNLIEHSAMLTAICSHPDVCHSAVLKSSNQSEATAARAQAIRTQAMSLSVDDEVDLDQLDDLAQELGDSNLSGQGTDWCKDIFGHDPELSGGNLSLPSHSLKVVLLLDIIRRSISLGERVLVFSRSIPTLDYLQKAVDDSGILNGTNGRSLRMDGSTAVASRQGLIDSFNAPKSPHYVFFISSRTGSIGVNLVAASRIIIFDVGWNPLYDEQAIARAYRYGQRRRVYVYRLMTFGTWEDNLFSNNTFKVAMTRRVVDRQTTGRRNTREDMRRYFQHPPLVSPTISSDDIARLADEYHDDSVFTSLLTSYASTLAKVIPQATLVAEEEEHLLEGDAELIKSFVISSMERYGHIPASSTPSSGAPATRSATAPTSGTMATSGRSLQSFNMRNQSVYTASEILRALYLRLISIPVFAPQHIEANNRRSALIRLLQLWRDSIKGFANDAGASVEQCQGILLGAALPDMCNDAFCSLIRDMYFQNDANLVR
ncbi:hypothetical protein GGI21_003483, partial [Coemansia aciculifera]